MQVLKGPGYRPDINTVGRQLAAAFGAGDRIWIHGSYLSGVWVSDSYSLIHCDSVDPITIATGLELERAGTDRVRVKVRGRAGRAGGRCFEIVDEFGPDLGSLWSSIIDRPEWAETDRAGVIIDPGPAPDRVTVTDSAGRGYVFDTRRLRRLGLEARPDEMRPGVRVIPASRTGAVSAGVLRWQNLGDGPDWVHEVVAMGYVS